MTLRENINPHSNPSHSLTSEETIAKLKAELERRGIGVVYFSDGKSALEYLIAQIPQGAQVMKGGSATLKSIGFEEVLQTGAYDYYRPKITAINDNSERIKMRRQATIADFFVGGANAISLTGEILNVDGSGNRIAGYAFGGGKVFLVAGVNKIVPNLQEAIKRLRHPAAAEECRHLGKSTPCAQDNICRNYECYPPHRQCGKILIIEKESIPGRITLVLIGESLGF